MVRRVREAEAETPTERIHRVYDELPEGERKAADLVLDRPGELALWSASELAGKAGISNATVTRFVRRLGYRSYDEARRSARAMRAHGSPLYLADDLPRAGAGALSPERLIEAERQVVEASLEMQNPLALGAVAETLAGARQLRIAGFRNSFFLAEYACSTLGQFRPGVAMLNMPGQTLAEGIAAMRPEDAVLVIGLRRRPAGFAEVMRAISGTGARIVLLADLSIRTAPALADHALSCTVGTPQALDSPAGALAVLRLLALLTMQRLDGASRRQMEQVESLLGTLGELE
ncbi:hypothetical protein LNKW23_35290 [Paralimibaculum aggregatum]|uniref:HTH rpiR-type domain-containing protein n=1 Tax=Paralimibaculum aggregatum TaxID=3036245 RepID=A0ABQ6LRS1_9RHOB|nr:MurR/RpiR family transcriptional regulator [Limibaculum sp. NKW23]GMG84314.1 hypothetical protein LNKW23_35290 [Limibaculum sp. NKW23]